ncbi:MAG: DUF11 domain-containing protein [Acidobacteria bacterium]|nr:DUF11 domain-containing protein [Acidobacteriota bacterium]
MPAISLVKSRVGTGPVTLGTTVTYNFLVTNTGNTTLTAVAVTDPLPRLSPVVCPVTTLAPAASTTCTATYVVDQADVTAGVINNTAMATGQPPPGYPAPTASDNETVAVDAPAAPGISLVKSRSGTAPATVGTTLTYNFLVTNTGNVTLTAVTVTDPLAGLSAVSCPNTTLTAGQAMTCTATYVVTQADLTAGSITNTATATGQPAGGGTPPTAVDSETVPVVAAAMPGISLAKTRSGTGPATIGSTITYNFLVTNTGNVTLTDVTVTDPLPRLSAVSCPGTTLTTGQAMTCTATYVVTQADADAGSIINTATATAQGPTGSTPPVASDGETVVVPGPVPSLPVVMTLLLAGLLAAVAVWRLRQTPIAG